MTWENSTRRVMYTELRMHDGIQWGRIARDEHSLEAAQSLFESDSIPSGSGLRLAKLAVLRPGARVGSQVIQCGCATSGRSGRCTLGV